MSRVHDCFAYAHTAIRLTRVHAMYVQTFAIESQSQLPSGSPTITGRNKISSVRLNN